LRGLLVGGEAFGTSTSERNRESSSLGSLVAVEFLDSVLMFSLSEVLSCCCGNSVQSLESPFSSSSLTILALLGVLFCAVDLVILDFDGDPSGTSPFTDGMFSKHIRLHDIVHTRDCWSSPLSRLRCHV